MVLYKDVGIGFSAEKAVKDAVKGGKKGSKNVSDRMVLEFREECKGFILGVLKKLLQKCSVIYSLARYMTALNPKKCRQILSIVENCSDKF